MARLRIISDAGEGRIIEVDGEVSLGRLNADATIEDEEISRRHVTVRIIPGALEVEDLGSANGTFVNDVRIEAPTQIGNGDRIRIGKTSLVAEEIVALQQTRISGPEDFGLTRARAVPDPSQNHAPELDDATRARPVIAAAAPLDATRARPIVAPPAQTAPPPAPATPAAPAPGPGSAPATAGAGAFHPPAHRRGAGLATRSWVPPVVSYGTVLLVAVALVIFFASR